MAQTEELPVNRVLQGDNVTHLRTFPDNCIDLTVTSPPYDVFDENWNIIDGQRKYKGYSWNFPELAKQLYRVTKPGGAAVWVVGEQMIDGSDGGKTESLVPIHKRLVPLQGQTRLA